MCSIYGNIIEWPVNENLIELWPGFLGCFGCF